MYNLKYTVPFTDVDGHDYEVRILVDGWSGSSSELTGAAKPFIVDVSDEQFLYTPTRFSGATLSIVGSDYLQDLFSTEYQMTKVDLYRGQDLLWTGFVTPDSYSQEYDSELFELSIECISAMSTLEYIDFSLSSDMPTFKELILDCISKSNGSYKHVYVPNTYDVDLSELSVSRSNFFDEDDEPMKLKEVLEEICKFLGWTCTEMNGYVCFIDVDYISGGNTTYTDLLTGNIVDLSSTIDVTDKVSKSVDNTMSILGGYNKVTVIDSDYEADSDVLFPNIGDCRDTLVHSWMRRAGKDGKALEKDGDKYKNGYYHYFSKIWNTDKLNLITYKYSNGNWIEDSSDNIASAGAHIIEQANANQEDKPNSLSWQQMFEIKLYDGDKVDKNKLLDGWYVPLNSKYEMTDISQLLKPTIKLAKPTNRMAFPSDAYLGVKFSMAMTPEINDPQFRGVPESLDHKDDTPDKMEGDDWSGLIDIYKYYFIPMKIQIGDKYWNGTKWTADSNAVCRVDIDITAKDHIEGKWYDVKNTNTYNLGLEDMGNAYVIPLNDELVGQFNVTIFVPYYMTRRSKAFVYIKNLEFAISRSSNPLSSIKNDKKDTKYTNIVNERFVNEAEDVKLKLTSSNESTVSLSKVVRGNQIVDTLSHKLFDGLDKPEKLIIKRIVNQYNKQKVAILYNIDNSIDAYSLLSNKYMQGKKFIYAGGQIDFAANSIECNMIELF